jgi:apolipoprotein N-acyltransferase
MEFYILPVLLTALPFDIALTVRWLRKNRKTLSILAPALFYFISALIWIAIFSQDIRFQGQGILGLIMFFIVGVSLALIRLFIGLAIEFGRKLR